MNRADRIYPSQNSLVAEYPFLQAEDLEQALHCSELKN